MAVNAFICSCGSSARSLRKRFEVPLLFQSGMQSADHVHLGDSKGKRIGHGVNNFVNCIFECVRVAFLGGKRAELAR